LDYKNVSNSAVSGDMATLVGKGLSRTPRRDSWLKHCCSSLHYVEVSGKLWEKRSCIFSAKHHF